MNSCCYLEKNWSGQNQSSQTTSTGPVTLYYELLHAAEFLAFSDPESNDNPELLHHRYPSFVNPFWEYQLHLLINLACYGELGKLPKRSRIDCCYKILDEKPKSRSYTHT